MLGERATHGQPTAHLGNVKNSPCLLGWTKKSMYYLHKMNGLNCEENEMLMHAN